MHQTNSQNRESVLFDPISFFFRLFAVSTILKTFKMIYPKTMKNLHSEIRQEMELLHFSKALALLDSIPEDEKSAADWFNSGICHSSVYAWKKAEQDYRKALELSDSPDLSNKIRLRLTHYFTQTGRLDQAAHWYNEVLENPVNGSDGDRLFYGALLDYERGDLNGALDLALRLARGEEKASTGRIRCEAWLLCGDLYSAKGDLKKAVQSYGESLRLLDSCPQNWRMLRKALILNNLADVYEQFEYWDQAASVYEQAWKSIEEIQDDQIFDLDGYRLEILMSMANFYALQDNLSQAEEILEKAKPIADKIDMPLRLYWESRMEYISGLCELYSENPKYNPFIKLFDAWKLQTQYLTRFPAATKEYLARTAYYAAYCYDPKLAGDVSQRQLYEQALDEFERCVFKDPKFFLFCIASVQNELGNLEVESNPAKAVELYEKSVEGYRAYLKLWPEDMLAQSSLLAVLLNLFGVYDEDTLRQKGAELLDIFEKALQSLDQDEETRATATDALARLLDDDKLYALYADRLEKIHNHMQDQTLS